MSQPTEEIEITNDGPIEHLKFSVPKNGGILVLHGPNGSGKSTALDALDQLVNRQGRLVTRDGTTGAEIRGFQARVALGRKLSRSGELEVLGLEGFNLADLVDPDIKDKEARDLKRIKALLRLADAPAKAELFYDIVGGQEKFDMLIPSHLLATEDLVAMQGSIKRALEAASRYEQLAADNAFKNAEASRIAAGDIDLSQPDDSDLLAAAYESARDDVTRLKAEATAYAEAVKTRDEAKDFLESIEYKGPTLQQASDAVVEAITIGELKNKKVLEIQAQLDAAKVEREAAYHAKELAEKDLEAAQRHYTSIENFQTILDQQLPKPVTESQGQRALEALGEAKTALETGALVRRAKNLLEAAAKGKQTGIELQAKADELRLAAQSTEQVLSGAVEALGVPLKVSNSRLIVTDTDRPNEVFDDLSDGEKWKLAASIAVKTVGPNGAVILPQTAWQDLDQANKQILAEGLEGKNGNPGVIVITAQADSSVNEITPKMFDPFALAE